MAPAARRAAQRLVDEHPAHPVLQPEKDGVNRGGRIYQCHAVGVPRDLQKRGAPAARAVGVSFRGPSPRRAAALSSLKGRWRRCRTGRPRRLTPSPRCAGVRRGRRGARVVVRDAPASATGDAAPGAWSLGARRRRSARRRGAVAPAETSSAARPGPGRARGAARAGVSRVDAIAAMRRRYFAAQRS